MNLLIFSDLHINKETLQECSDTLNEIIFLCQKHSITKLINAGDTFDIVDPRAEELDLFANFIKKLNLPIIILAAKSHESISSTINILNHYGILDKNVTIVSEFIDRDKLYVGHYTLTESKINYGTKRSKTELEKYRIVVLGHQHIFQEEICHIGSCRFVNFDEAQEEYKRVLLIENYEEINPKLTFLRLNTPIPMKEVILQSNLAPGCPTSVDNLQVGKVSPKRKKVKITAENPSNNGNIYTTIQDLCSYLDNLPEKTKVRVIFKDYELWRLFLPIYQKYKDKFTLFRDKKDFLISVNSEKSEQTETKDIKRFLTKWLEDNKIEQKIQEILLQEIKNEQR